MSNKVWKFLDRNVIIFVILTSIILSFYNIVLSGVYIIGLILAILVLIKWHFANFKKLNNLLVNLGISVITIFILTIIIEVWLQLYPHKFTGIDGVDTIGKFRDYTSRGYLTEGILQKKQDVVRILTLGDSFSVYLRDKGKNYHNFLQKKLFDCGKVNIEIVNAGMEAMGPGYYWHILNNLGDIFRPDLLLVGFFVGNDFEEADFSVFIGNFISEPKDLTKRYSKYYQFRRLRLYQLLKNKYTRYRETQLKKQEVKHSGPQQVGTFSQETFLEVERARSWIFDKNNWKLLQYEWRKCSELILKMKDWCDQRKIKLVIAILPDQFQVDQELREAVLNKYKNIADKNLDLSHPDNLIVDFCRAHGINYLDMLRPFQEKSKTERLYALRDTHWNEAGNRLAADLIFEYLEENQLLPSQPRP